jgi:nicotinate dehydrogenase subunit A
MITLTVNGTSQTLDVEPDTPLLYVLRDDLALHGPKFGCGLGQCGACTVLVDGAALRSCSTPVAAAAGKKVVTLEGLGTSARPHPVQQAFIDEQAAQCGYCVNGMIMTAKALLDRIPNPSDRQIRQALAGNLCRCGTHQRIVMAAEELDVALDRVDLVEGNVIQTVSRTLKEELKWNRSMVTSLDWKSYPILTFPEAPQVDVELLSRPKEPPWGAGEPSAAVVPSAISNAIFDAVGARVRTVPFTPERVQAAIRAQS